MFKCIFLQIDNFLITNLYIIDTKKFDTLFFSKFLYFIYQDLMARRISLGILHRRRKSDINLIICRQHCFLKPKVPYTYP